MTTDNKCQEKNEKVTKKQEKNNAWFRKTKNNIT